MVNDPFLQQHPTSSDEEEGVVRSGNDFSDLHDNNKSDTGGIFEFGSEEFEEDDESLIIAQFDINFFKNALSQLQQSRAL